MDIVVWLRSLGLGKYEAVFRENEIDETVLPSLTEEHLKHGSGASQCALGLDRRWQGLTVFLKCGAGLEILVTPSRRAFGSGVGVGDRTQVWRHGYTGFLLAIYGIDGGTIPAVWASRPCAPSGPPANAPGPPVWDSQWPERRNLPRRGTPRRAPVRCGGAWRLH